MLQDARMAAMRKLHRSVGGRGECRQRADVGRGEIVRQDRRKAANGSKEPKAAAAIGLRAKM